MEVNLRKQDWENLRKDAEMNLRQAKASVEQFSTLLDLAVRKIAEFPTETTPEEDIVEALKE